MENDIQGWLSFTVDVKDKLQSINDDIFSESYRSRLTEMLGEIRREAAEIAHLSPLQK